MIFMKRSGLGCFFTAMFVVVVWLALSHPSRGAPTTTQQYYLSQDTFASSGRRRTFAMGEEAACSTVLSVTSGGHRSSMCPGSGGHSVGASVVGTSFATIPSDTPLVATVTVEFLGEEPPIISAIYAVSGTTEEEGDDPHSAHRLDIQAGPPSEPDFSVLPPLVTYCLYSSTRTSLPPLIHDLTFAFTDPQALSSSSSSSSSPPSSMATHHCAYTTIRPDRMLQARNSTCANQGVNCSNQLTDCKSTHAHLHVPCGLLVVDSIVHFRLTCSTDMYPYTSTYCTQQVYSGVDIVAGRWLVESF